MFEFIARSMDAIPELREDTMTDLLKCAMPGLREGTRKGRPYSLRA